MRADGGLSTDPGVLGRTQGRVRRQQHQRGRDQDAVERSRTPWRDHRRGPCGEGERDLGRPPHHVIAAHRRAGSAPCAALRPTSPAAALICAEVRREPSWLQPGSANA